jgi:hypothetical protein
MELKEIRENNLKIAKFMGLPIIDMNLQTYHALPQDKKEKLVGKLPVELRYENSWEWLMPVIEAIEKETIYRISSSYDEYELPYWSGSILKRGELLRTVCSGETNKLTAAYKTVVAFIDDFSETQTHKDNKKEEIEVVLRKIFTNMFMDVPSNFDDILEYVYDDVCEVADEDDWNDNDVLIGFRRWIEGEDAN